MTFKVCRCIVQLTVILLYITEFYADVTVRYRAMTLLLLPLRYLLSLTFGLLTFKTLRTSGGTRPRAVAYKFYGWLMGSLRLANRLN